MTLIEAIRQRRSVRTFLPEMPDGAVLDFVRRYIDGLQPALPGTACRLALIEKTIDGKIGTYGVVRGAQCYVGLAYDISSDMDAVGAGIVTERLVLELVSRGLGTVWLGGTFSAADLTRALHPAGNEKVVALLPFGIPAPKESFASRLLSKVASSAARKPFDELFTVSAASPFRKGLELMRLAPSAQNKQDWRAVEHGGALHFFCADSSRFGMLDMGIGMCHFALAAPDGAWTAMPEAAALLPGCRYVISWK